jgi:hypothetical protein
MRVGAGGGAFVKLLLQSSRTLTGHGLHPKGRSHS